MDRTLRLELANLIFNAAFAIYHLVLGLVTGSWWLFTLGTYYLLLGTVRFVVIHFRDDGPFITGFTGWMLIILCIPLSGTVILSVIQDRGLELHIIVMIAMAVYAFTKIILATVNLIKSRRSTSAPVITLRSISFTNAFVSIFALQRSMLVSFDGMSESGIVIMNAALGSVVCAIALLLGIILLVKRNCYSKH